MHWRSSFLTMLLDDEVGSIAKAAKLVVMSKGKFIDYLGALKIPVACYGNKELQRKLAALE